MRSATGDRPSLERQLQNCVKYCALKLGSDPEFVFQDPAKSGMLVGREGLDSLLSAIRSGQITDIIVEHVDRLARGIPQVMYLMELCESNNVIVHEATKGSSVNARNLFETEAERNRSRLVQLMSAGRRRGNKRKRGSGRSKDQA
ncbi:recombinase family protein [Bradyrhizobium sp. 48]|nr:recombinase family protein [Bradyrhizobium sp. 48]MCK1441897.1 recombinase family protein [Bradyrhizobium sp. 48]